jgi:hypothetical protein
VGTKKSGKGFPKEGKLDKVVGRGVKWKEKDEDFEDENLPIDGKLKNVVKKWK